MKFKNFISAFFLAAAVVCLVACSDDEDEVLNDPDDNPEVVEPGEEPGDEPDEPGDEPDEPVTSALSAPTGITATDFSGNWVTITWNTVEGAAAYKVRAADATGDVFSQIVSVTECTIENLTPSTTYIAYVKALAEETEGSEYDSEEASREISTTNDVPMIAPTNPQIVMVTHGFAIIGWELSDEAITQQPSSGSQDDMYDFRLKDASGKVLRLLEDDNCFNFAKYVKHQFVWGGLQPSTTYSLELRRKPTKTTTGVVASDWVSATFTTDADPVPDKSGYLLFYDFENVPFGGSGPYEAYGTRITLDDSTNYDDPDALPWINTGDSNLNYVYTQTISDAKGFNQSFFDNYLPGVTPADFTEGLSSTIAVAPGYLKFGASSLPNWFSLPALDLTSATDVLLELDVMPYIEPSSSGDMMSPSNSEVGTSTPVDSNHFYVDAGNATISSVECEKEGYGLDGEQTDTHVAYIRIPTVAEMKAEGETSPYWTTYKIHISGLTGNDRIKLYTDPTVYTNTRQRRMWMDNIKISKEN